MEDLRLNKDLEIHEVHVDHDCSDHEGMTCEEAALAAADGPTRYDAPADTPRLVISAKCGPFFGLTYQHKDYRADYGGECVPPFGDGMYVDIEINPLTGQILNWEPFTHEDMDRLLDEDS